MIRKHVHLIKIGDQIRTIRTSKGLYQEGFSAPAILCRTYVGQVERGEQNISIQHLIKIAFTPNVSVGELLPSLGKLENPAEITSHLKK